MSTYPTSPHPPCPTHPCDDGSAAVEFALVMPLLALLLLGIIQYGYGMFQIQAFSAVVGTAARQAGTGVSDCASLTTMVQSLADNSASAVASQDITDVQLQWLVTTVDGDLQQSDRPVRAGLARVTASFSPTRLGGGLIPFPDTVTRSATALVQDVATPEVAGC